VPLGSASLSVLVDGVQVATLTTALDGTATVSWVAAGVGGHTIRVDYAGDATHAPAQRTQGLNVKA